MVAAVAMPPAFGSSHYNRPSLLRSPYRPVRPSPLSSPPLRAASPPSMAMDDIPSSPPPMAMDNIPSSPPLRASSPLRAPSPEHSFVLSHSQSSPIQPSASPWAAVEPVLPQQQQQPPTSDTNEAAKTLLRFASRAPKQPPRQSREAARQTRRALFLHTVRRRADDQAWDRRNCEQEIQKLEWWSLERAIRQAKESDTLSALTEHDFEEAAAWTQQPTSDFADGCDAMYEDDDDGSLAELVAREDAELEAMIESMEGAPDQDTTTAFSDDGDYDALFAELLAEDVDMA